MLNTNLHPTEREWEEMAREYYKKAYPELLQVFRQILGRAFFRCHWIPEPIALDYLTKVLIRFLPYSISSKNIEEALAQTSINPDDPREIIRFYENAGELILWWSGIYRRSVFRKEGKRSYTIAYEQLSDYEIPTQRFIVTPDQKQEISSKRL